MTPALTAAGLDRHPGVTALLERLGLGAFRTDSVRSFPGRNDNWAGPTTSGRRVFVKLLGGDPVRALRRLERILAFERLGRGAVDAPACLGWDRDERLVAFELLESARTGHELAVDEKFSVDLAARAGRMIGTLHSLRAAEPAADEPPALPALADFDGLAQEIFDNSSAAELQAWRLMQSDRELRSAVADLLERERAAPAVPAHCDLRLDQFLLDEGHLQVIDWEEFRAGDAARDLGSFAGEWLRRAVIGIWQGPNQGAAGVDPQLTEARILASGTAELQRLRPLVTAFWGAYRTVRSPDPGLAARATAFAGWHMFDRMLGAAAQRARIGGIELAAAGIGRNALLRPDAFSAALGFVDA